MGSGLPQRKFSGGKLKMFSIRLPDGILSALQKYADENGWNRSDVIITALDQYLQDQGVGPSSRKLSKTKKSKR